MDEEVSFAPLDPVDAIPLSGPGAPADRPPQLQSAQNALEEARNAFHQARKYMELWRVLARDEALHDRMGQYSMALGGFFTLRWAVTDALLLAILRMFEADPKGDRSLSFIRICKNLADPTVQAYLKDWRVRERRPRPAAFGMALPLDAKSKAEFRSHLETNEQNSMDGIQARFDELTTLQGELETPNITGVIKRLKFIRDKEVAHRDLKRNPADERAKYKDFEILFDLADRILNVADDVARGFAPDIASPRSPIIEPRCLVASWRAETEEELKQVELALTQEEI
ncbi:AbiU2 domain-containing protein [Gluconobacter kondonii]|uniref:AbiU2 domain-containing protein n=1 Tax=Gluconobacter kondonii TaxID=941463 RepID=UPI001B8B3109|nr:hypothetical protein [Gluconobacter kondonii]MBS1053705.1 hypothetical protein [Gluconobacter kondonii]